MFDRFLEGGYYCDYGWQQPKAGVRVVETPVKGMRMKASSVLYFIIQLSHAEYLKLRLLSIPDINSGWWLW